MSMHVTTMQHAATHLLVAHIAKKHQYHIHMSHEPMSQTPIYESHDSATHSEI